MVLNRNIFAVCIFLISTLVFGADSSSGEGSSKPENESKKSCEQNLEKNLKNHAAEFAKSLNGEALSPEIILSEFRLFVLSRVELASLEATKIQELASLIREQGVKLPETLDELNKNEEWLISINAQDWKENPYWFEKLQSGFSFELVSPTPGQNPDKGWTGVIKASFETIRQIKKSYRFFKLETGDYYDRTREDLAVDDLDHGRVLPERDINFTAANAHRAVVLNRIPSEVSEPLKKAMELYKKEPSKSVERQKIKVSKEKLCSELQKLVLSPSQLDVVSAFVLFSRPTDKQAVENFRALGILEKLELNKQHGWFKLNLGQIGILKYLDEVEMIRVSIRNAQFKKD